MKKRWHDNVGMVCVTCGADCKLIVERRDSAGRTFRIRVCSANKLHRFTTVEVIIGGGSMSREARKFIQHTKWPK